MASTADDLVRTDIESFVRKCFTTLHPHKLLGEQPYVSLLCNVFAKLVAGEITRLIVNLPPRHLKSFIWSICLAAWWLAHRPSSHIMIVTYSELLARNLGYRLEAILRSPWFQHLFPTRILRKPFERDGLFDCSRWRFLRCLDQWLDHRIRRGLDYL